ncbi:AcrR family transcriptional regulator [Desulfomicrobium macestii]|uniref:Transcriptional regulator, TetR family n=2 Tax=Desulfomicrobium TaxID=898 RepID=A0A8G2C0Y4_DESNO|nr:MULTISPECIES: TetR/AcrR family transcriptional regulator [Desulfomicrobium]MBE1423728.1 AcrR family transcriptional regulator [Desulfomicrobium macestii]SFL33716.1 transcriptional regulator, TetR family [Desulfomicrobium norvegicum]
MAKRLTTIIRREQIAEAALALVADQGVGALTARNVARAVGVTAPALYRHFPGGKADILASVLDLLDDVKTEGIRQAIKEPGPALTKLRRCYDLHISVVERYRALPNLVLSDALWSDENHLRERLLKNHQRHQSEVAGIIRQGQIAGEIRDDIDADEIFVQFLGQFLTIAILYSRRGDMIDPKTQAEANWKMFVRGVSP